MDWTVKDNMVNGGLVSHRDDLLFFNHSIYFSKTFAEAGRDPTTKTSRVLQRLAVLKLGSVRLFQ